MDEVYHFGVLFKQISLAFETAMQREAERYDLTPAQANILIYLSEVDHGFCDPIYRHFFLSINPFFPLYTDNFPCNHRGLSMSAATNCAAVPVLPRLNPVRPSFPVYLWPFLLHEQYPPLLV